MSIQHKQLNAGRWAQMTLVEQLANVGSEVERALYWKSKSDPAHCQQAFERALELMDFTLDDLKNRPRLKELARVREALVDYFAGSNSFVSTPSSWHNYFSHFTYAARRNQ
jgi:hypothetical protein